MASLFVEYCKYNRRLLTRKIIFITPQKNGLEENAEPKKPRKIEDETAHSILTNHIHKPL